MSELTLLHLEDNDNDARLIQAELERSGFVLRLLRARSKAEYLRLLDEPGLDAVLADYAVPGFDGKAAVDEATRRRPEVPCLIVTGSLDEQTAVELLKRGAADYILKDSKARLGAALRAALERRRAELAQKRAEEDLRRVNECLLSFGPDSVENIQRLTALCGELLKADCVLYSRLDRDALFAVGQWRVPQDFNAVEKAEGRRCLAVIRGPAKTLDVCHDAHSNPLLARHGFKTALSFPVRQGQTNVGSLCALFAAALEPDARHERVLSLLAAAVGVEEERLAMDKVRARLAEELRQAQKMDAIGRLAGGVAHDFNNALTAIQGHCELLLMQKRLEPSMREDIAEIVKAAGYAASLTRQLLAFSRRQFLSPKVLDLNHTAEGVARILRRTLGAPVRLELKLAPALGAVVADPGQMEQVLMNLALNARDAMPEGGVVTIATEEVDIDDETALEGLRGKPGRYVALSVTDTGHGMDEATLSHLFEPFFTTKEKGKGTGLGLSTVYGIVRQSGGDVAVESAPGRGTRFTVYLPRTDGRPESAAPATDALHPSGGSETVLLVEDEAPVRALFAKTLRNAGYRVIEARNGEEALDASLRYDKPIDLLVTDVVMPGMNGRQLATRLETLRPSLQVLYISGYTNDAISGSGLLAPGVAFLQKPFTPSELARRVRALLDAN